MPWLCAGRPYEPAPHSVLVPGRTAGARNPGAMPVRAGQVTQQRRRIDFALEGCDGNHVAGFDGRGECALMDQAGYGSGAARRAVLGLGHGREYG